MFSLFDEAKLSDIPEVSDADVKASLEALAVPSTTMVTNEGDVTATDGAQQIQSPCNVYYTISTLPSGSGKMVTFYLNTTNLLAQAINQFVMLCDCLLTPEDVLMVHLNSTLYCDESETIFNAIYDCKAKKKIGSAPYTLNSAALFPILACNYMIGSPYCFAHFDVPSVRAGGVGYKDATNAMLYDKTRKFRLIEQLKAAGFIPDKAFEHICEHQGSYTLYGNEYMDVINKFNSREQ